MEPVPVFQCSDAPLPCAPVPISLEGGTVYLSVYGTGIRGSRATVTIGGVSVDPLYAGQQGQFAGLDQVNVAIPASLAGRGVVEIRVAAAAQTSNGVTIAVQ
jgi:uncharacterized protein (TIGR03437 family)